ncbi:hypothetical protein F5Y16DRAFT_302244 [Xylariaceae sp. FL0255]|nr:hypothetical protein F5Y16DRAFT_302244 [Xylariaceae sp. FL0255]
MASSLDDTTLSTISLLESRLSRIEHALYGPTTPQTKTSAVRGMQDLEHRFSKLVQHIRVYGDLLKLYKAHPTLFQPPPAAQPPPELSQEALRSIVLSAASSYPAAASALTAMSDAPIPDPAHSASLAALTPRMKAIEATQLVQAAEIADLRTRSEIAVRQWYQHDVMGYSNFVAGVEGRVERVERTIRRLEKANEDI